MHIIFPFNNKFNYREGEREWGRGKEIEMKMKNLSAFPDVLRFLEQKTLGCIHVVFGLFLHTLHTHNTHTHTTHTHTNTLAGCMHICRWSNDCGPATVFFYTAAGLNCLAQALPRPPPAQQRQSIHYTMLHTCTHNLICSCNCFGPYGRDGKRFCS